MSDTESDEDLKKAFALSLQQASPSPHGKQEKEAQTVDLVSSDSENDDLDAPVKARLRKNVAPVTAGNQGEQQGADAVKNAATLADIKYSAATSSASISNDQAVPWLKKMDRARMEEERLQRLARTKQMDVGKENASRKRKEPDSSADPSTTCEVQAKKASKTTSKVHMATRTSPESKDISQDVLPAQPLPLQGDSTNNSFDVLSYRDQQRLGAPGIQSPYGVVKKTWVNGCPRTGDDIRIEEVLQKNDLELAVLSSFQLDSDWVISKLEPQTKVIWILQAKGQSEKDNIRSGAPTQYRFCFPSMEGNINFMHSKLQLLAHPTHLRIVVPSANLTSYDWGETGVMENVLFLIDLPRIPGGQESHNELSAFGRDLVYFLQAMGLNESTINSLKNFKWTNTENLAFVHSIGGSHTGSNLFRTGVCGLGAAVRSLGMATDEALYVEFLAASLGSLNDSFLKSLYLAAQGDNGLKEYTWRSEKPKNRSRDSEAASDRVADELKGNARIYFPTRQTVENSKGGRAAGGTICFQRKWYDAPSFDMARSLLVDCQSERKGILSHSKMIFTRSQSGTTKPWVYVGSANLSESAWGRLAKNRKGELTLNCRNWECGVIVPLHAADTTGYGGSASVDKAHDPPTGFNVFRGQVPVPMKVPGKTYEVENGEEPWFYSEHL